MSLYTFMVATFVGYVAYVTIAYVLLHRTKATRSKLSAIVDELIGRDDIDEAFKNSILNSTEEIFSWKYVIRFSMGFVIGYWIAGNNLTGDNKNLQTFYSDPQILEYSKLSLLSGIALNPLMALVAIVICFILCSLILILRVFYALIKFSIKSISFHKIFERNMVHGALWIK